MYQRIINDLFVGWNSVRVDFCVVRNFEFLAERKKYGGKDLDITLRQGDLHTAEAVLFEAGFKRLFLFPGSHHRAYVKYISGENVFVSVHFHIDGVSGSAYVYVPVERLLKNKVRQGNYFIPSKEDQLLVLFLHCLLNKGFIEKYVACMKQMVPMLHARDVEESVREGMAFTTNLKMAERLVGMLKRQEWRELGEYCVGARAIFNYGSLWRKAKYITLFFWKVAWWVRRLWHTAPMVSIIGMDGAGKSTAMENIRNVLEKSLVNFELLYFGRGRNNILPIQFFGQRYHKKVKLVSSQLINGQDIVSFRTRLLYSIAAPVFALDLWLRYVFVALPARKRKHVVITDRFASDILLMKNVPTWLKRVLYFFLPKPTVTVYLYNDIKILHKRKDHPWEDYVRQEKIFGEINKFLRPVKVKSESLDPVVNTILEKIFKIL